MLLRELGEFGLIARLGQNLGVRDGVVRGIGDDAAVLAPLACPVISADALIEGIHFRRDWTSPRLLGRKSLSVNLSDLAAAGAAPVAVFLCLALGPDETVEFLEEFYAGMEELALRHDFTIAGGDMTRSPAPLMISVTIIGKPYSAARGPLSRAGARPGDVLLVSGSLGASAAGLALLTRQPASDAISATARELVLDRHLNPTARLDVIRAAMEFDAQAIHAALDLSDGLGGDAWHLARRSGLEIRIRTESLPVAPETRAVAAALGDDPMACALSGGEDYELLLAVAPQGAPALCQRVLERTGVALTAIGECVEGQPVVRIFEAGRERQGSRGFTHF